jgi:hypothetical protein
MPILFNFIKSILVEVLITLLLIFIINNYIGNVDRTINADGVGYYDYLPSVFIHHDLVRYNTDQLQSPEKFKRINSLNTYLDYKNSKINRYLSGTAILQSPFFIITLLKQGKSLDITAGYEAPYQRAIFYAAVFYLFLTIVFLKKILLLYDCSALTIIIIQLLLVLGTSVTDYVNFDASYSHIYSLFVITVFIFLVKRYFKKRSYQFFLLICVSLGLILLIRPVNGIVIFFIPFLAGSFQKLKEEFLFLFKNPLRLATGIILTGSILSIQFLLWYLQTGNWVVNTYGDVGFDFFKPEWVNVLFSYRKGLFVYTPILIFSFISLVWFAIKGRYYELVSWLIFFILATYMISSWKCWFYGGSFGQRVYIDFYSMFFIVFALMFDKIAGYLKIAIIIPAAFFVYLNIVQTYQYKEFILHWDDMNEQRYWTVFLKTAEPYKGLVWKKPYDYMQYQKIEELAFGDFTIPAYMDSTIALIHSSNLENAIIFQVGISNDFNEDNDGGILLVIKEVESNREVCWHQRYLQHFNEKGLNQYHAGLFNYELPAKLSGKDYELKIVAHSGSKSMVLKEVKLKIFKK